MFSPKVRLLNGRCITLEGCALCDDKNMVKYHG